MKLTEQQKSDIAAQLSYPYGRVKLLCDGFTIDLVVERWKAMNYRVMTYINGKFEGQWIGASGDYPERKFLRKSVRPIYSARMKADLIKIYGKRKFAKQERFHATVTMFFPDFASGKAAIAHLSKVCDSIEIAEK